MKAELFSYALDEEALKLAELMDGKLLVVEDNSGTVVVGRDPNALTS